MLYLLAIILLLLKVLFAWDNNDIDCNTFIRTSYSGLKQAFPIGQCRIANTISLQYLCNGTDVDSIAYNSTDCTGNVIFAVYSICKHSHKDTDCIAICDKSNCNSISRRIYNTKDCSGNAADHDIQYQDNYLPGNCLGEPKRGHQWTCTDNGKMQIDVYSSNNCTGNPYLSEKYDSTCKYYPGGRSIKYIGCNFTPSPSNTPSNSPLNSPTSSPSNSTFPSNSCCTIFTLFGAIITIFISSLF